MRRKDDIYLIDDIIHKAILHLNYWKPVCIKTDKQKVLFYFDKIKI
jgi:hypothetical protein